MKTFPASSGRMSPSYEQLLGRVLASAPVVLFALDHEGKYVLVEGSALGSVGLTGADLVGKSVFDVLRDAPEWLTQVKRALEGETTTASGMFAGAHWDGRLSPLRDEEGRVSGVVGVATNVTTERRAERAQRSAEERLRRVFGSSMLPMCFWNVAGAISEANDAFLELTRYSRADVAEGKVDWSDMTPPEMRGRDASALEEIAVRGVCTPFEKEYIRKDGVRIPVLIGGARLDEHGKTGVAFVVDLRERRRVERACEEAEARLRTVVGNAPLMLWAVDRDAVFTLSEGRGLASLGLSPGQLVGRSAFEVYADAPKVCRHLRRGLAGEEFRDEVELAALTFETTYCPLRSEAGDVVGLLGVSTNVTDRHRAQRESEQLQLQLLQAQKLESLGLLAGGIAHDFNNLLTAILGSTSIAALHLQPENAGHRALDNIALAARRAAGLTRQLLAYAGRASFDVQPVDLSAHVRELLRLLESALPKSAALELALADDLPAIDADVAQLQQVVMNLVVNAGEALADRHGKVHVSTGVQEVDERFAPASFVPEPPAPGRYVYVEVHDTGCGMDAATKAKVFDPFFSTKLTGRGLGLAAVLGIVRAHRGAIAVFSDPGRGTTFRAFFPESRTLSQASRPPAPAVFAGRGLALVIDDDDGVRGVAQKILEHFGFDVLVAPDGRAGVEALARKRDDVRVVLLDLTMPDLSGEETLRELRRICADVPVILTSGYDEDEARLRLAEEGIQGFLQKPFAAEDMAARLAAALGETG